MTSCLRRGGCQRRPFLINVPKVNTEIVCCQTITDAWLTRSATSEHLQPVQQSGFEPVHGTVTAVRLHMVSTEEAVVGQRFFSPHEPAAPRAEPLNSSANSRNRNILCLPSPPADASPSTTGGGIGDHCHLSNMRQRERESAHRGKAAGELPNCLLMFCLPTQEKDSKGWEQTFLPFLPCISSSRPTASCFCGLEWKPELQVLIQ